MKLYFKNSHGDTRVWHTEHKGQQMTKFDVGSHTEFFYLDQIINLKGCMV